jgi:hypothetical protein
MAGLACKTVFTIRLVGSELADERGGEGWTAEVETAQGAIIRRQHEHIAAGAAVPRWR